MTTENNKTKNSNHLRLTTSDLEDFSDLLPKRTKASLPSSPLLQQQQDKVEVTKNKKLDETNNDGTNNTNRKENDNNSNGNEDSALIRNFLIKDEELEDALNFVQDSFPSLMGGSKTTTTEEMEQLSSWNNSNIRLTASPDRKQTTLFSKNAVDSSPDAKRLATASKVVSWKDMNKNEQQFKTKSENDNDNDELVAAEGGRSSRGDTNDISNTNNNVKNIDEILKSFFGGDRVSSSSYKKKADTNQETKKKDIKTMKNNAKKEIDDFSFSSESEYTEGTNSIDDDGASAGTSTIIDDNNNNMNGASTTKDGSNDDDDATVGFLDDMYYAWGDCCTSLWTSIKHYAEETKNDCIHEIYMSAADIVDNSTCSPNALRQKASKYANNASSMLACAKGYNNDNYDDDTYTVATFDEDESLLTNNVETNSRATGMSLSQEKKNVRQNNNNMKSNIMKQRGKKQKDSDSISNISDDTLAIKRFLSADTGDSSFSLGDTITERDEPSLPSTTYSNKSKKNNKGTIIIKDEQKKEDINELHSNLRELQQNMKDVIHETAVLQQMVALQQINNEVQVKNDAVVVEKKEPQKPLPLSGTTATATATGTATATTTRVTKSVVKSRAGLGRRGDNNHTTNKTSSSSTKHASTTTTTTAKQQQQQKEQSTMKQTTSAFSSKKKLKSSNKKNKE